MLEICSCLSEYCYFPPTTLNFFAHDPTRAWNGIVASLAELLNVCHSLLYIVVSLIFMVLSVFFCSCSAQMVNDDDDDDDDEGRINFSVALSPKTTRTRNNKPQQ